VQECSIHDAGRIDVFFLSKLRIGSGMINRCRWPPPQVLPAKAESGAEVVRAEVAGTIRAQ